MQIPNLSHSGSIITNDPKYFKKPHNIGKILSAESTIENSDKPSTLSTRALYMLISFAVFSIIALIGIKWFAISNIMLLSLIWSAVFVVSVLLGWVVSSFLGTCTFVGEEGFSLFEFKKDTDNITEAIEIHYNDITDLYSYTNDEGAISYYWMNNDHLGYNYFGKDNINFMNAAKTVWTLHQNKKMHEELKKQGFIMFNVLNHKKGNEINPCVRLWNDKIEFILPTGSEYYTIDELKNMEIENSIMYFQHNHYDKKHILDKEKKNKIPLLYLGNRLNFIWAMKWLYGFDAMILFTMELSNMQYFKNALGLDETEFLLDKSIESDEN